MKNEAMPVYDKCKFEELDGFSVNLSQCIQCGVVLHKIDESKIKQCGSFPVSRSNLAALEQRQYKHDLINLHLDSTNSHVHCLRCKATHRIETRFEGFTRELCPNTLPVDWVSRYGNTVTDLEKEAYK